MSNIIVLNAPFFPKFSRPQRSPAVTKSGTLYYPMWLAYAAAVLEAAGHEVDLIDAPAKGLSLEQVTTLASEKQPDIVIVDSSTPSIKADIEAVERIKLAAPSCMAVLVGPHASALPEQTLSLSGALDVVAIGEYDYTMRDLASAFEAGTDISAVLGIVYRDAGGIRRTPARPLIEDLDKLPFVTSIYRKYLNPFHYFNPNAGYPNVTMITGRGCPHRCSFCVYPQTLTGNRYRVRSIGNVIEELEYVLRAFPEMKEVFFEDDTLTGNSVRCAAFCQAILDAKLDFSWVANSRADLDYATMRIMKKAGCRELCVGFESGNQAQLDSIEKKISVAEELEFMRSARRAGILVHGCFMVGFIGETEESMERTFALARELAPDSAQFYPMMVYPGTRAYEDFKAAGMLTADDFGKWLTPSGLHNCVTRTESLSSEELVRFCDDARRRFYLAPRYLLYKLLMLARHPSEFGRTFKAARTFMRYLVKGSY